MSADRQLLSGPAARRVGIAVVLVAVAAVGFWSGRELRRWRAEPAAPSPGPPPPGIAVGEPFPGVALVDSRGDRRSAAEAVGEAGGAVLFLEPGCPACGETVQVWQSWIEAGEIGADRVVGISTSPHEALAEYRRSQGLTFAIYRDPAGVFQRDFGVAAVPLTVFVAPGGTVREVGYESPLELDLDGVIRRLARDLE